MCEKCFQKALRETKRKPSAIALAASLEIDKDQSDGYMLREYRVIKNAKTIDKAIKKAQNTNRKGGAPEMPKYQMTALFDRRHNSMISFPVSQGEIVTVWRDDDFSDSYFCQKDGDVFGMEGTEILDVFGYRPDQD